MTFIIHIATIVILLLTYLLSAPDPPSSTLTLLKSSYSRSPLVIVGACRTAAVAAFQYPPRCKGCIIGKSEDRNIITTIRKSHYDRVGGPPNQYHTFRDGVGSLGFRGFWWGVLGVKGLRATWRGSGFRAALLNAPATKKFIAEVCQVLGLGV